MVRALTDKQLWFLTCVADYGLHGSRIDSDVIRQGDALVKRGFLVGSNGRYCATDEVKLAHALSQWGRAIVQTAREREREREHARRAAAMREKQLARCAAWLERKRDASGTLQITPEDLYRYAYVGDEES